MAIIHPNPEWSEWERKGWDDARAHCEETFGPIMRSEERPFIEGVIGSVLGHYMNAVHAAAGLTDPWTGDSLEHLWYWDQGVPPAWGTENWNSDDPMPTGEDFYAYNLGYAHRVYDFLSWYAWGGPMPTPETWPNYKCQFCDEMRVLLMRRVVGEES